MANPVSLTINELPANSAVDSPAFQTIDTNGTVNCPAKSYTDGLTFGLQNNAAQAITVTVKAGTGVQAHTARDLAVTLGATGSPTASKVLGPFESARFVKADGSLDLAFQAASGAPNLSIRAFRHPRSV